MKISKNIIVTGGLDAKEVRHCSDWEVEAMLKLRPLTTKDIINKHSINCRSRANAVRRGWGGMSHALRNRK